MFRSKERIAELEGVNDSLRSRIRDLEARVNSDDRTMDLFAQTLNSRWDEIQKLKQEIRRLKQGVQDAIDGKSKVEPLWCSCPVPKLSAYGWCRLCRGRVENAPTPQVPRVPECACRAAEAEVVAGFEGSPFKNVLAVCTCGWVHHARFERDPRIDYFCRRCGRSL
jgi:uncharacterized coiled-coil protein SlyX